VFVNKIKLKNFRCFKNNEFNFDSRFVIFQGDNGIGKTSLLEAIYYTCYLKSFRTRLNKELPHFESEHFFLQVDFDEHCGEGNSIHVGYSEQDGKIVKFNKKQILSYKDVTSRFRVISIAQDDLLLVTGSPDYRRAYLNQSLFLLDSNFMQNLKKYKQVLDHRNSFLAINAPSLLLGKKLQELKVWTKQLWEQSITLQRSRVKFLKDIEVRVNSLLNKYFDDKIGQILLKYLPRNIDLSHDFDGFWGFYEKNVLSKECKFCRGFFGAHLDDFTITLSDKRARVFASRGQQKMVLFLLKIVQLQMLQQEGEPGVLLLDDFLTDFDQNRLTCFLNVLKDMNNQVFLTSPLRSFLDFETPFQGDFQLIKM